MTAFCNITPEAQPAPRVHSSILPSRLARRGRGWDEDLILPTQVLGNLCFDFQQSKLPLWYLLPVPGIQGSKSKPRGTRFQKKIRYGKSNIYNFENDQRDTSCNHLDELCPPSVPSGAAARSSRRIIAECKHRLSRFLTPVTAL